MNQPSINLASWPLKGYSHSASRTTLLSPLNLTAVESAQGVSSRFAYSHFANNFPIRLIPDLPNSHFA
jgi:hypothetical protein